MEDLVPGFPLFNKDGEKNLPLTGRKCSRTDILLLVCHGIPRGKSTIAVGVVEVTRNLQMFLSRDPVFMAPR